MLCISELYILLKIKPFKSKPDSSMNVICEFCLLGVYSSLTLIQFVSFTFKIIFVWIIVGFVLFGNTVGFFILVHYKRIDCKKEGKRKKELK